MPCKQDVFDEFFATLNAQRRVNQTGPALDEEAADDLAMHAGLFRHMRDQGCRSRMRRNAMSAAVAAMRVVLSLDDAII